MFRLPSRPRSPLYFVSLLAVLFAVAPLCPAASSLSAEKSAYLRAQAGNPVQWQAWNEATLARAKQEQKPLFLFVGSATNELTRATHRQTFSNADAAAYLNENFVCVLVDAKEQPELSALYQSYLQAAKQLKGMPMSLWLTPELKPFEGANYLPPTEEWGKEGFLTVAKRAGAAWKADAAAQRTKADEAVAAVEGAHPAPAPAISPTDLASALNDAADAWIARYDAANTGFGDGSKYPEPELLRFLLTRPASKDQALATLKTIATSSLHDPLDGGFFRYATDPAWHIPYLQKNAADQARLALAFLEASKVADAPLFQSAARSALAYVLDRLASADGALATAEDATADDLAVHFYPSYADLKTVLGDAAPAFAAATGATEAGNLAPDAIAGLATAGKNVLAHTAAPDAASAAKLLAHRDQLAKPLRDEGAPAAVHGLVLNALARAGADLADARFAAAAKTQVAYLRAQLLTPAGELRHLAGAAAPGTAQDYALVARGLLVYGETAKDTAASQLATALLTKANALYFDATTGRYLAVVAQPAAGLWTKVFAPEPPAGDLPSADVVMAITLRRAKLAEDIVQKLTASLAADVKAATETARGDQLNVLSALQP